MGNKRNVDNNTIKLNAYFILIITLLFFLSYSLACQKTDSNDAGEYIYFRLRSAEALGRLGN